MIGPLVALLAMQAVPETDPTITVVGRKAIDAEYAACRDGGCDPNREANATLAYAQQQLLAGDYRGSRKALKRAIRRHSQNAATHPDAVSALYDANSTVALHVGEHSDARRSGLRAIAILDRALGETHPRAVAAVAQRGSMEEKIGNLAEAEQSYKSAAKRARAAGMPLLADVVDLRRAWLLAARDQDVAAQKRLTRMADDAGADRRVRLQAAVLAARVAREREDYRTAERMIAMVGTQPAKSKPLLVWAPPINDAVNRSAEHARRYGMASAATGATSGEIVPIRWVDVGFWVRPDGKVDEVEVLRGSKRQGWAIPVLQSIEGRRYAAFAATTGDPGNYRIERFTFVAPAVIPINSLIKRNAGKPELRWLDITDDPTRKLETS
ncbi:hypothetical protein ACFOMD_06415 [Sphingoaurantiacus capsulatus]|uniref:Tetratricopeptide repeat protein n=1 Tax=Sphingoaurantiacus capsulatus TaxID=1771310 RepID=A0ABV7XA73_9SPHN